MRSRRRPTATVVLVALLLLALAELYVLVQVGQAIGAGWTLLLLVGGVVAGAWVIRHEGSRAWRALREALDSGRMPATELADGALVLIGGTLLALPGFISDAIGVLLIVPLTRPVFRRLLAAAVARRVTFGPLGSPGGPGDVRRSPGPGPASGPVVRGEVVDDDD